MSLREKFIGLKVGFIGCGKIAHYHAEALACLGVGIQSVCGASANGHASEFAKQYGVKKVYKDAHEMLKYKADVCAWWVVADWRQIPSLLMPVIKTKIPCFFEKPVALSSKKLSSVILAAKRINSCVMVGYNRRFYDFIPRLKEMIRRKKLLSVDVQIPEQISLHPQFSNRANRRYFWFYSSSHVLDLLLYLVGPLKTRMVLKTHDCDLRGDMSRQALLTTSNQVPVHIDAQWDSPARTSMSFCFADRTKAILSPLEHFQVFKGMEVLSAQPGKKIRSYEPQLCSESFTNSRFKPGFYEQAKYFFNTFVEKRNSNKVGCDLEDAYRATRLCERLIYA